MDTEIDPYSISLRYTENGMWMNATGIEVIIMILRKTQRGKDYIEVYANNARIEELQKLRDNIKERNVDGDDEGSAYYYAIKDRIIELKKENQ